jgi:hypothetical protein
MQRDDERIKFSDRVLLKLADRVEHDGNQYYITTAQGARRYPKNSRACGNGSLSGGSRR